MNSSDDYRKIVDSIRRYAKNFGGSEGRIVFTNGCFDIIHPGHLDVIRKCRELAGPKGTVVVALNSDASVKRLKGPSRPFFDENTRCEIVTNVVGVDFAVTFEEDTPRQLLEALRPHIVVKGGDYQASEVVGSDLALVVIVPTRQGFSTTETIRKIDEPCSMCHGLSVGDFCDECESSHG